LAQLIAALHSRALSRLFGWLEADFGQEFGWVLSERFLAASAADKYVVAGDGDLFWGSHFA